LSSDFKMRVRYFLRDNSPEVAKVKRVDEVVPHLIDYLERIIKNNLGIFFRSDEEGRVHEQLDYKKNSEAFDGVIWHQQRWNHYIYRPQRILFQLELQIERTPKTKSFFGHVFRGIWYFNFRFKKLYFKKCLYKDGKLGLKYSFMRALDAFLVEFFVGLKPRVNNKYWSEEK
ncbi:MAG: hypothetical protein Q8O89_05525, partial [Nanoarchaeota archaeon]|nr:hypothetical protein [Nanoarchaeota archaeon]